jgi:spore maturation protein CgeB
VYYLENEGERERIARNGYETVMKYHSSQVRARQLVDFLATLGD